MTGEVMAEIDRLLKKLVKVKGSDLHLSSNCPPFLRVNGRMHTIKNEESVDAERVERLLREILPAFNKEGFNQSSDTDFAYEIPSLGRFRVNLFRDRRGVGGVFRLIPQKIFTAEELNLPQALLDFCQLSKGLILITGPTGSGKSTTLCALIDLINRTRHEHIITIEDPIEFVHENKKCLINQREIHCHTASFKTALRAALREDPDILLIGEMRDLETIEMAIETAETGHLVFGTVHTNTAASTMDRIIDQFPADKQNQIRQMLADSLKGIVSQTLVKRRDGTGRIAAMEILVVNAAVANLLRQGKTHQIMSIMQTSSKQGMQLLNKVLLELVVNREVSPEAAYTKSVQKEDFISDLSRAGIELDPVCQREMFLFDATQ